MPETGIIHSDQRFITALLHNDDLTVKEIYEKFSGKVKYYVLDNQGSLADAADIFQEALIDIYRQAKEKALKLTCPFESFLLLVCKRKWLNVLKKRGRSRVTNTVEDVSEIGEDMMAKAEDLALQDERVSIFMAMFEKLGEKCREIIRLSLSGQPQEEMAASLNVSYGYLRKKKSECMAELIKSIKQQQSIHE